jgi:heterodisulfide reductase subunit A-like polyferredoxin
MCPFDAIQVNGAAAVTWDKCMGCGVCVSKCSNRAISIELDENKGIPLDVWMLTKSS